MAYDILFYIFVSFACIVTLGVIVLTFTKPKIMLPLWFVYISFIFLAILQPFYLGDIYFHQSHPNPNADKVRVSDCNLWSRREQGIAGYCEFVGWVNTMYSPISCVPSENGRDSCG